MEVAQGFPTCAKRQCQELRKRSSTKKREECFTGHSFPPPPDTPAVPPDPSYPPPICRFRKITKAQIERAIDRLQPYKAHMEGDIANIALKHGKETLVPYLLPIYNATITLRTYPEQWKTYDSIVI